VYLKIDFESDVPIYTQLRNQIVEGIASGELKEGEELPSVRQMAEDIGINMHTVNKTYNLLKQEGFIKLDRRKGAVINLSFEETKDNTMVKLEEELKVVLAEAYCKNITREEMIKLVNNIYKKYEGV
jgi:GntR family transcriptional regulator